MTINEFLAELEKLGVSGDEQLKISAFGGIGSHGKPIRSVFRGIDWDTGAILIDCSLPLWLKPAAAKTKGGNP